MTKPAPVSDAELREVVAAMGATRSERADGFIADLAAELLAARRNLREIHKYGSAYGHEHPGLSYVKNLAAELLPTASGG